MLVDSRNLGFLGGLACCIGVVTQNRNVNSALVYLTASETEGDAERFKDGSLREQNQNGVSLQW